MNRLLPRRVIHDQDMGAGDASLANSFVSAFLNIGPTIVSRIDAESAVGTRANGPDVVAVGRGQVDATGTPRRATGIGFWTWKCVE